MGKVPPVVVSVTMEMETGADVREETGQLWEMISIQGVQFQFLRGKNKI